MNLKWYLDIRAKTDNEIEVVGQLGWNGKQMVVVADSEKVAKIFRNWIEWIGEEKKKEMSGLSPKKWLQYIYENCNNYMYHGFSDVKEGKNVQ